MIFFAERLDYREMAWTAKVRVLRSFWLVHAVSRQEAEAMLAHERLQVRGSEHYHFVRILAMNDVEWRTEGVYLLRTSWNNLFRHRVSQALFRRYLDYKLQRYVRSEDEIEELLADLCGAPFDPNHAKIETQFVIQTLTTIVSSKGKHSAFIHQIWYVHAQSIRVAVVICKAEVERWLHEQCVQLGEARFFAIFHIDWGVEDWFVGTEKVNYVTLNGQETSIKRKDLKMLLRVHDKRVAKEWPER